MWLRSSSFIPKPLITWLTRHWSHWEPPEQHDVPHAFVTSRPRQDSLFAVNWCRYGAARTAPQSPLQPDTAIWAERGWPGWEWWSWRCRPAGSATCKSIQRQKVRGYDVRPRWNTVTWIGRPAERAGSFNEQVRFQRAALRMQNTLWLLPVSQQRY